MTTYIITIILIIKKYHKKIKDIDWDCIKLPPKQKNCVNLPGAGLLGEIKFYNKGAILWE